MTGTVRINGQRRLHGGIVSNPEHFINENFESKLTQIFEFHVGRKL